MPSWDEAHWRLPYTEKHGKQLKALKERDYFDPSIAGEKQLRVDYENKNGVKYSELRQKEFVGWGVEERKELRKTKCSAWDAEW